MMTTKMCVMGRPASYVIPESKMCPRCQETKPADQFGLSRGRWLASYCKRCTADLSLENYRRNPARTYANHLLRSYGLSVEEYEQMVAAQGGGCQICRNPERRQSKNGRPMKLVVDHDSQTGVVRGLLCAAHNSALGLFDHDPALLRAAAEYLERN